MENSQRATVVKARIVSNKLFKINGNKYIYCDFSDGKKDLYLGSYNSSLSKNKITTEKLIGKTWPEVEEIIKIARTNSKANNKEDYWRK